MTTLFFFVLGLVAGNLFVVLVFLATYAYKTISGRYNEEVGISPTRSRRSR